MWELGVLRAIGMTNQDILKLTIYESLANNLSSVILGLIIGVLISVCMVSQFLIFLELPFILIVTNLSLNLVVAPNKDFRDRISVEFDYLGDGFLLCNKDHIQKEDREHPQGHRLMMTLNG